MYGIEILIDQGLVTERWSLLRPTGGDPYRFDTAEKAWEMANICYPDECRRERLGDPAVVRVVDMGERQLEAV